MVVFGDNLSLALPSNHYYTYSNPVLVYCWIICHCICHDQELKWAYPVRSERQSHALQLASWLAEAEVVLFRLWDYEVELDLFPQQEMGECEGMQR